MLATLRVCALGRIPSQPWKPSSPFMHWPCPGPDPSLARLGLPRHRCWGLGSQPEARQLQRRLRVPWSGRAWSRQHTICQRTDKECKDYTLTITTLVGRKDASINKRIAIESLVNHIDIKSIIIKDNVPKLVLCARVSGCGRMGVWTFRDRRLTTRIRPQRNYLL